MHLGSFIHTHRFIGNVIEEGIEAVHSKLSTEMDRNKMSKEKRLMNALKWLAIDVILADSGKIVT